MIDTEQRRCDKLLGSRFALPELSVPEGLRHGPEGLLIEAELGLVVAVVVEASGDVEEWGWGGGVAVIAAAVAVCGVAWGTLYVISHCPKVMSHNGGPREVEAVPERSWALTGTPQSNQVCCQLDTDPQE